MYNTALRIVVHTSEAEDVLQESFTKVFQRLHSFRRESTLGAWIKRIVVNTALNHLRQKKKLQFVPLEAWAEQAPDIGEDPETWDASMLHDAIKKLPDGCRVVFTLFLVENMGHKDIAQDLGISESTSKTQYMRAKKLLREHLLNLQKAAI
ncbi:MAG: sigma-70 family RNA polymerase sigma factor [Saprospiraceae bacterium]|nr:sigma-70 family RNA polymerase sigma factor [Saprospiraceae bacterium]